MTSDVDVDVDEFVRLDREMRVHQHQQQQQQQQRLRTHPVSVGLDGGWPGRGALRTTVTTDARVGRRCEAAACALRCRPFRA